MPMYTPPDYLTTIDVTPSIVAHSHSDNADFDVNVAIGLKSKNAKFDIYIDPTVGKSFDQVHDQFRDLEMGVEGTVKGPKEITSHFFIEPWDMTEAGDDVVVFGASVMKPVYKGAQLGIEADKYNDDNRFMVIGEKAFGRIDINGGLGISNLTSHDGSNTDTTYQPFVTEKVSYTATKMVTVSIEGKHWVNKSADELKGSVLFSF